MTSKIFQVCRAQSFRSLGITFSILWSPYLSLNFEIRFFLGSSLSTYHLATWRSRGTGIPLFHSHTLTATSTMPPTFHPAHFHDMKKWSTHSAERWRSKRLYIHTPWPTLPTQPQLSVYPTNDCFRLYFATDHPSFSSKIPNTPIFSPMPVFLTLSRWKFPHNLSQHSKIPYLLSYILYILSHFQIDI